MRTASLWAICAVLAGILLTAWVPARWPVSIVEAGAFVIALAWVVRAMLTGRRPRLSPILLVPAVFVLWGGVQLAFGWTVAAAETERGVLIWGAYLALVFSGLQTFDDAHRERFLRALLAFGFVLSVLSTVQSFTSEGRVFWWFPIADPEFMMGPFLNHSHFAAFVELILPLALVPAMRASSGRFRHAVIAGVLLAAVIASASRFGFVLSFLETVFIAGLCCWKNRRILRPVAMSLGMVLLAAAGFAAIVGGELLMTRLKLPDPFSGRQEMLESSIAMIRDHGMVGVGLGNWPTAYPRYANYDDGLVANQAHNDWAQWAAEGGIPGLAAGLFLLAWVVRQTFRHVWCGGALFVLIHAIIDFPMQKPEIAALFFMMLAAVAGSEESEERTNQVLTL